MDAYGYPYSLEIHKQNPGRVMQFHALTVKLDLN